MIHFGKIAVVQRLKDTIFSGEPFQPGTGAVDIRDDGQPAAAYQGYVFLGIHGASSRTINTQEGYHLHEEYQFSVTTSLKTGHVPNLRFGPISVSGVEDGVEMVSEYIIDALHGSLTIWSEANNRIIAAGLSDKGHYLSKAPHLLYRGRPAPRTNSWFGASLDDRGTPSGVSQEIRFGGLEVIRYIGDLQA